MTMILPDLLDYNLNIVFCGMAASKKSKQVNAYYAGPSNKFWKTLYNVRLTSKELKPKEFKQLITYKIGLTDICKTDFGNDNELDPSKYDVNRFNSLMIKYQPKIVCFNGKNAAKVYFNRNQVEYEIHSEKIGETELFIVPSTSGAACGFWDINLNKCHLMVINNGKIGELSIWRKIKCAE